MRDMTLKRLAGYTEFPGPVVTVIMDGVGIGPRDESNGVYVSYTPTLDVLLKEPLFTRLKAHGTAVGMPSDKDMGNSEVGHNAFGAGRIFAQGAKLVNEAIKSGSELGSNLLLTVSSPLLRVARYGLRVASCPAAVSQQVGFSLRFGWLRVTG